MTSKNGKTNVIFAKLAGAGFGIQMVKGASTAAAQDVSMETLLQPYASELPGGTLQGLNDKMYNVSHPDYAEGQTPNIERLRMSNALHSSRRFREAVHRPDSWYDERDREGLNRTANRFLGSAVDNSLDRRGSRVEQARSFWPLDPKREEVLRTYDKLRELLPPHEALDALGKPDSADRQAVENMINWGRITAQNQRSPNPYTRSV